MQRPRRVRRDAGRPPPRAAASDGSLRRARQSQFGRPNRPVKRDRRSVVKYKLKEVPFVRISRDKRGYEYFALVHTTSGRRGKVRQRTLYWFRTPPNVKVGRPPFDDEIMRALEAQYPDVTFDWDALRTTPMPPPSVEHWRERRRAEKAMRQFRAADEEPETPVEERRVGDRTASADPPEPRDEETLVESPAAAGLEEPGPSESAPQGAATAGGGLQADAPANLSPAGEAGPEGRRRRRRRRGRRGRSAGQPPVTVAPQRPSPTETAPLSSMQNDSNAPSDDEPVSDEDE